LVEEMAAAASSLRTQAQDLVQVVAVFQISESQRPQEIPRTAAALKPYSPSVPAATTPKRPNNTSAAKVAVAKKASVPAPALYNAAPVVDRSTNAGKDDEWESF